MNKETHFNDLDHHNTTLLQMETATLMRISQVDTASHIHMFSQLNQYLFPKKYKDVLEVYIHLTTA